MIPGGVGGDNAFMTMTRIVAGEGGPDIAGSVGCSGQVPDMKAVTASTGPLTGAGNRR